MTPMSDASRQELQAKLAELKRKADKRRNEPGFQANLKDLDLWISEIEAELAE